MVSSLSWYISTFALVTFFPIFHFSLLTFYFIFHVDQFKGKPLCALPPMRISLSPKSAQQFSQKSQAKGLERMLIKVQWYVETYTTCVLRISRYGAAEVFIDFAEEFKHTETNPTCYIHKSRRTWCLHSRPEAIAWNDLPSWSSSA